MVVGTGMIGTRFEVYKHQEPFLVFASGVSNSGCNDASEFAREMDLLKASYTGNPDKHLVYFSTCSILDVEQQGSLYVQHKRRVETWIQQQAAPYTIFRISNPIGYTANTHTFFNFFIRQIVAKEAFDVWKFAARNILDIDDMYIICDYILNNGLFTNKIVNVANITNYSVLDIVEAIEHHYHVKGNYRLLDKGNGPLIPTHDIHPIISQLKIDFSHHYLKRILNKYFSK